MASKLGVKQGRYGRKSKHSVSSAMVTGGHRYNCASLPGYHTTALPELSADGLALTM